MSFIRIWIHAVFGTEKILPVIEDEGRIILFNHIQEYAKTKEIHLDSIGGYQEHVHLLLSMNRYQNVSDLIQHIRGESSYWANKQKLFTQRLQWDEHYFAISVSQFHISGIRRYIRNQEQLHLIQNFHDELEGFKEKNGWDRIAYEYTNNKTNI